jgi:hypothetical protein
MPTGVDAFPEIGARLSYTAYIRHEPPRLLRLLRDVAAKTPLTPAHAALLAVLEEVPLRGVLEEALFH